MARVVYYLEFSDTHPVPAGTPIYDNFPNGRRHILEIIDNDASGANQTTPNVIGDANPVQLIWDNTDDIYNSIMSSRLVMNFLSDDVKMIDVEEIINNEDPSRFEVKLLVAEENTVSPSVETFKLYWKGWITNVEFEQKINSTPVPYQLIASDLLPSLKNVTPFDGNAVIASRESTVEYLSQVLAFLHYGALYNIRIYNNIQHTLSGGSAVYLQDLPHAYPFTQGFQFKHPTAYEYLEGTLKTMNARLFVAEEKFYIIPNVYGSSTMDTAITSGAAGTTNWDGYENSLLDSGTAFQVNFKEYTNATSYFNVTKNIDLVVPTDIEEVGGSLAIRYESPINKVIASVQNNPITPEFDSDFDYVTYNLTAYPSLEIRPNVLYNNTYYSNDFSVIDTSYVLDGNYSFKTNDYNNTNLTKYSAADVMLDTGLSPYRVFSKENYVTMSSSIYVESETAAPDATVPIRFEYSLIRDRSATADFEYAKTNLSWDITSNINDVTVLHVDVSTNVNSWTDIRDSILNTISAGSAGFYAQYRLIVYKPKCSTSGFNFHFDNTFINRYPELINEDTARLEFTNSVTNRDSNSYNIEIKNPFNNVGIRGNFSTPRISSTTFGNAEIIAQQILNDNRQHVRRYSITVKAKDGYDLLIYPWHKIWINYNGYESNVLGIIDRLEYVARRGVWNIEFHIPNQNVSVSMTSQLSQSDIKFIELT
jgi:hypothetical protein